MTTNFVLHKPFAPISRLPLSVGDSDHPEVFGSVDIKQGKRKFFEADLLNARQFGKRWISPWIFSDGVESFSHALLKFHRQIFAATPPIKSVSSQKNIFDLVTTGQ